MGGGGGGTTPYRSLVLNVFMNCCILSVQFIKKNLRDGFLPLIKEVPGEGNVFTGVYHSPRGGRAFLVPDPLWVARYL